ncbi:hypothetical protein V5O48_018980, partial [Marasmius crinis-equi]
NSGEKPSKAAKRFSGDDAATSSSSINDRGSLVHTSPPISSSSIPSSRYGNGSNGHNSRNPYVTPYSGNAISGVSGLPAKPRSSASVEDGVFRHVQHGPQTPTPSKPVSFWKSVSSSAIADERKEKEKEKDEEPKLGLKHFRLLYEEVGKDYVCRECKSGSPPKRKIFPQSTAMPEMTEHSWKDHPERCKEILKYSASKLTEEQMLLKGGGGMLLGRSAGTGGRAAPPAKKEKSGSK